MKIRRDINIRASVNTGTYTRLSRNGCSPLTPKVHLHSCSFTICQVSDPPQVSSPSFVLWCRVLYFGVESCTPHSSNFLTLKYYYYYYCSKLWPTAELCGKVIMELMQEMKRVKSMGVGTYTAILLQYKMRGGSMGDHR